MRVLFTALSIESCGGVEMYLLDLSRELVRRGWKPCVYAPTVGPFAEQFQQAAVPVCDDLRHLHVAPDIIHGNFGLATFAAACRFPQAPIVSMSHAWHWPNDIPPLLPNVHWYLAVDETCRERLLCQLGVAPERVQILQNAVDLTRFAPRPPLPARPQQALVFSNYFRSRHVKPLQVACRQRGISLASVGNGVGNPHPDPETLLPNYDLVFAKGRCAWEALATGCAVIVCDVMALGPMVTTSVLQSQRRANFGRRLLTEPLTAENVGARIEQYDAADAAKVSQEIRGIRSLTQLGDEITALYEEVAEGHAARRPKVESDSLTLADYAQRLCREYTAGARRSQRRRPWRNGVSYALRSMSKLLPPRRLPLKKAA